jgi:hypothetical protein
MAGLGDRQNQQRGTPTRRLQTVIAAPTSRERCLGQRNPNYNNNNLNTEIELCTPEKRLRNSCQSRKNSSKLLFIIIVIY